MCIQNIKSCVWMCMCAFVRKAVETKQHLFFQRLDCFPLRLASKCFSYFLPVICCTHHRTFMISQDIFLTCIDFTS